MFYITVSGFPQVSTENVLLTVCLTVQLPGLHLQLLTKREHLALDLTWRVWSNFLRSERIPDICDVFSTDTNFSKFFSTKKRVNRDKKLLTKQRKSPKNWFYNRLMRQNTTNCTRNFSTFSTCHIEIFYPVFLSCGACGKYQVCVSELARVFSSTQTLDPITDTALQEFVSINCPSGEKN